MKEITKCHALQVYVFVKKMENVRHWVGFFVHVCVMSLAALRIRFLVCFRGLVVSLWDTNEADILGRSWYVFLTAGRKSCVPQFPNTDIAGRGERQAPTNVTPHGLNDINSQGFNHRPLLALVITYIILTEIILSFYGVTATQLTTFVPLCSRNITLKMAAIAAETCW